MALPNGKIRTRKDRKIRTLARPGYGMRIDNGHWPDAEATVEIKFGSVSVNASRPSRAEMARNLRAAHQAMEEFGKVMLTSGVDLKPAKGVPFFHADPRNPGLLVRRLNGRVDRGRFVGSEFQVLP